MIPATLSAVGFSLSEFVDSMIVGQLLSSDAFAIVNLGAPIVLVTAMVYTIAGLGGSLMFAESLGKKEPEKADGYFTVSIAMSVAGGLALFAILMLFHSGVASLFGCPVELKAAFDGYIRVLCLFIPFGTLLMALTYYLPVIGMPYLSTGLVVSANALNVGLDVVFMRGLGMGCEGAAAATACSYAAVLVAALVICFARKVPLSLRKVENPRAYAANIVKKGLPSGSVQAGYAITGIFCNHFMNLSFGVPGVVCMSLFTQMDSVFSIALAGIVENNAMFAAMLKGEGDYFGIRHLSAYVTRLIVIAAVAMAVLCSVFSQSIAAFFNIHDPAALALIATLVPLYVTYYPLRCILFVLRGVYNALDRYIYAALLGILDKAVSVPLVGSILYAAFGGYGIVAAFPVGMALILAFVACHNAILVRRTKGRYSPVLLLDEDYPLKNLCSHTVNSLEDAAAVSERIEESLEGTVADKDLLNKLCMAAEEMGVYIIEQCGEDIAVDFLISTDGSAYIMTCRSPGRPFFPIVEREGELSREELSSEGFSLNELVLTKVFNVRNEYIFGMNSTSLTIAACPSASTAS